MTAPFCVVPRCRTGPPGRREGDRFVREHAPVQQSAVKAGYHRVFLLTKKPENTHDINESKRGKNLIQKFMLVLPGVEA
jgi:hypothetical protein